MSSGVAWAGGLAGQATFTLPNEHHPGYQVAHTDGDAVGQTSWELAMAHYNSHHNSGSHLFSPGLFSQSLSGPIYRSSTISQFANDWPAPVPSRIHEMARRIEELEAENVRLRSRRLSATWEHLPDVTAPVRDHAALWRAIRR